MPRRIRLAASLCVALAACVLGPGAARAEQRIANVSQGTNFSLAIFPDREWLVIDLLGRLWRVPASGGGAEPLTPADEAARHPRVAPDGRQVVYQRLVGGQWDLWLLDVDTGERRALLATEFDEREPDFTRDGRSVVFASNRTGTFSLWRVEIDSGVLTQLTAEPGDASFPTVSEHDEIAYVRRDPDGWSLRALLPSGAAIELLESPNRLTAPSWREGDGVIVYNEQRAAVNDAGPSSELKMLVLSARPVVKTLTRAEDVFESRVAWLSPGEYFYAADGRIWRRGIAHASRDPVHVFAAVAVDASVPPAIDIPLDAPGPHPVRGHAGRSVSRDGRVEVVGALGDLWLVERRGAPRRLTDDAWVDIDPSVSPDGELAVFASDRGGDMDLWKVSLPGGVLTQLTRTPARDHAPAVSPDGRTIAFLETDGIDPRGASRLRVLPAAGGAARTVATGLVGATSIRWDGDDRISVELRAADGGDAGHVTYDAATGAMAGPSGTDAAAANEPAAADEPRALPEIEWRPAGPDAPYAIQVGRLFDSIRSDYVRHVDVHIEGQRIKAIVARGMLPLPERVIDLRDGTIIPGLIDVHAESSALLGERLGRAWLAHGVTTVREHAADVAEALERAESWASGRRLGPRLVVSPAGPVSGDAGTATSADPTGAEAPQRAAAPYPIPVHGYSNLRSATSVFPALVGAPLALPVPTALPVRASPLGLAYDDVFNTIIESRTVLVSGLGAAYGVSPGSSVLDRLVRHPVFERLYADAERRAWLSRPFRAGAAGAMQQHLLRLIRAGGLVAVGTGAPTVPYGLGVHVEMALLADAGIAPDQVLRIATAGNALALGLDRQLGTLEPGKLADFVVVDGNPLANIADALNVVAVVKGGVWLDQAELAGR
ncbi:MAG TPA: amidohydrolase family protein [Gammaproteobacteria bacterium]